jgi:hypothetical protein
MYQRENRTPYRTDVHHHPVYPEYVKVWPMQASLHVWE